MKYFSMALFGVAYLAAIVICALYGHGEVSLGLIACGIILAFLQAL